MSGVKGRSGRRPEPENQKRLRIIDRAWELTELYFNDPNISVKDKMETAKAIVTKDMVEKQQHSGSIETNKVSIVHNYVSTNGSGTNGHRLTDTVLPQAVTSLEQTN